MSAADYELGRSDERVAMRDELEALRDVAALAREVVIVGLNRVTASALKSALIRLKKVTK